jgi:hypothetical protein
LQYLPVIGQRGGALESATGEGEAKTAPSGELRTRARFPDVELKAGHYESFYIKACQPGGGRGIWIRHTVHKRPGAPPKGSLWFTLFDEELEAPLAGKDTHPSAELSAGEGAYIRLAGASLEPDRATGSFAVDGFDCAWDLEFSGTAAPFFHLPYDWMYRAPIPRTKFLSPHPNVRYSGKVSVKGREIDLQGWPGMIGHNWGAEHAERWTWLHGADFADRPPETYFDAALGRIKVGPFTTPWVGNGVLVLDGEAHRLGGLDRIRSTEISDTPTSCLFAMAGKGIKVSGRVGSDAKNFVGWVYADPDGPEHNTVNCSIADMELTVERPDRPAETLAVKGAAAYELGMRETDHGIPVQPYPDG